MNRRLIVQDNLWFSGRPLLGNYYLNGRPMVAVIPKLGFTDSHDVRAKTRELRWLHRYTGGRGKGVVIAQQWHRPGNRIDRNLRRSWLSTFRRVSPRGRWCIFYDPILATGQRGLVRPGQPLDLSRPKVFRQWRSDLRYLRQYFDHPQYWRLGGRPVIYVWAAFALRDVGRAFAHARERGLYVLADVLGSDVRPPHADGITGFTVGIPGLERQRYRLPDLMPMFRRLYTAASSTGYDFIPAGSCQYDDTAFLEARGRGERPLQILAANRQEIEAFLTLAMSFSRPIDGTRYLFWGTLNNWAEGTSLLPTRSTGAPFGSRQIGHYHFAHLEAVRNAVFR